MKDANLSTMFLPLVAILAVLFPLATQFPAEQAEQAIQTLTVGLKSPATSKQPNNAAALICEFAALDQKQCNEYKQGAVKNLSNFAQTVAQVETLIATIPDPRESSFDYSFDRYLEAIQRAFEATGYTIDRYDLPWLKAGEESKPNIDKAVLAALERLLKTGKASEDDQASPPPPRPGVILFRKNVKDKTYLLALFLIGETPTRGIQKAALTNALEQAKLLSQTNTREPARHLIPPDLTMRLLGPTFTGSATSLSIAVRSWLENNATWRVNIISGGATGIIKADFLDRSNPAEAKDRVSFAATVTHSSFDLAAFINKYLVPQSDSVARLKIAMLHESNTAYGSSISDTNRRRAFEEALQKLNPMQPRPSSQGRTWNELEKALLELKQAHPNLEQATHKLEQDLARLKQEQPVVPILELPFPLNISELRTEAEKANSGGTKRSVEANPTERKNVPLGMGQGKESSDVVSLTSKVEIASRELVLANLLTTIKREGISYVGLAASNVQDRIFLVRAIRQHCPNVVIFMLSADLLHLHPEAQADFRGVLMVTPYSLFNPNQSWTYPFSGRTKRLQFPAHGTQGTYNATLALLNRPELMLEYGSPFDSGLIEGGVRKPSLWVSVVGRDRVWPIKTLEYQDDKEYLFNPGKVGAESLPKYKSFEDALKNEAAANPIPKDAGEVIADLPDMINGALSSKMPLIGLLLLSLICCVPSGVLLLELVRTKVRRNVYLREKKYSRSRWVKWLSRQAVIQRLSKHIVRFAPSLPSRLFRVPARLSKHLVHKPVAHQIACWRIFRAIDRSHLAMIFSDPVLPDPRLKFKRRCYLLVCSLILLGLALIIALVYPMPIIASLKLASKLPDAKLTGGIIWQVWWEGMKQYLLGSCLAVITLLLTLPAATWMTASILDWIKQWLNYKYFQPLKNRLEQAGVAKRPFLLWLMAKIVDRVRQKRLLLNEKFHQPLKNMMENARKEKQPIPLLLGWFVFLAMLIFKVRLAASAGLLTAATFVYWDLIWKTPERLYALIKDRPPQEDIFFFLRATDLLSGVSPLLPLLFVGLAAFLAVFSSLRRLALAERACCENNEVNEKVFPFLNFEGTQQPSFSGIGGLETKVKDFLWCSFWKLNGGWLTILALGGICALLFLPNRASLSLEGRLFDVTFGLAFSITVTCLAIAFLRFVCLWVALRRLLRRLSWHPLFADESEAARKFFAPLPKIKLTLPRPAYSSMTFSLEQAQTLVNHKQRDISTLVNQANWRLRIGHRAEDQGDWRISLRRLVKTQYLLAKMANLVAHALETHWKSPVNMPAPASADEQWVRQGKLFLASRVTSFLHLVLAQLKNLAVLVTTGLLLILLAISSYPFQPREGLMLFGWIAVLTVVAITLVIFVQMGRDKVMSLLSGTMPGQLNWSWDFTLKVLLHGLLPILALLGAQFPNVIGQLISWVGALQGGHH